MFYNKNEFAIEANNLSKSYHVFEKPVDRLKQLIFGRWKRYYREYPVLKGVSLQVKRSGCFGVIGRNGAGKSTLLQVISGILQPTEGSVVVRGRVAAILELGAGFNPDFTGKENVYLYAGILGVGANLINQRMESIAEFAEIGSFIDMPVKTYSSGMQARLAFAVIAHVDADILIVDEALSVGDARFTQKCLKFIREFKKNGTIFLVSHDLATVGLFCDEVIWIEEKTVKMQGKAKDVCESYYAFMQGGSDNTCLEPAVGGLGATNQEQEADILGGVVCDESQLHNDLQIIKPFGFNFQSNSHGNGDAKIVGVEFLKQDGNPVELLKSLDKVKVVVKIEVVNDVSSPIVGFIIKDRLGQPLIGGNTYRAYADKEVSALAGDEYLVEFQFKLPILAVGDYSIVAAVANGTLDDHVHLHWMHDAIFFNVVETSIDGVIVGMPLDKIIFSVAKG